MKIDKKYLDNKIEKATISKILQNDFLQFARYFFKVVRGTPFKVNWHHKYIAHKLMQMRRGEIQNLIINVPPGSSKTELISILFPAWCFAIDKHHRFLCTSCSDSLVEDNSSKVREILKSKAFQELFGEYVFKKDKDSKADWAISDCNGSETGVVHAMSIMSTIIGKRAGYLDNNGFTGAIIIDDPLKPQDINSKTERDKRNEAVVTSVKTRKCCSTVPVVMVMQRLHSEDPTNYLLTVLELFNWDLVVIPAMIDLDTYNSFPEEMKVFAKDLYPEILEKGVVSYWEEKECLKELQITLESSPSVFYSQYQQNPTPAGGNLIKTSWWQFYDTIPTNLEYIRIVADTASSTKTRNDYSVFLAYGVLKNKIYVLDILRGKWESPELIQNSVLFFNKISTRFKGTIIKGFYIEYASSGQSLIQHLKSRTSIPVISITRTKKDKVTRVNDIIPYIESGRVFLPSISKFNEPFIEECMQFNSAMSHRHDDQVDCITDAITIEFVESRELQKRVFKY